MYGLSGDLKVSKKVAKEVVLLLGSRRALLMQVAHPLVAQGAKHYSNFRENPLKRYYDTLDFSMTMVFGGEEEKMRWIKKVNAMHSKVKGIADDPELPENTGYSAKDPNLLLWVHATLMETAILVYEKFVGSLSEEEKDKYYWEAIPSAVLLGIPEKMLPASYSELEDYIEEMITSGEVKITEDVKNTMDTLLHPYPAVPHFLYGPLSLNVITAGLLHPAIRDGYGLKFGIKDKILFEATRQTIKRVLPFTPRLLRTNPYAHEFLWELRRMLTP